MALSTDTKLFGLDLSAAAGQLRAAWGQLMGLPLLRRSLPAALVRVVKADGGLAHAWVRAGQWHWAVDRKSTRLNSSHLVISYAVFCLKKKKQTSDRHHGTSNLTTRSQCTFPRRRRHSLRRLYHACAPDTHKAVPD